MTSVDLLCQFFSRLHLATPLLLATLVSLLTTTDTWAGSASSLLDISADGRLLACSNRDSGSVTIVDLTNYEKRYEIDVGQFPEGVTFPRFVSFGGDRDLRRRPSGLPEC